MKASPPEHESCKRLFAALEACGFTSDAQMARALNATHSQLNNWKTRGVSEWGALAAQREFGISATWVLDGAPPRWVAGAGPSQPATAPAPTLSEPRIRNYPPELSEVLEQLAQHLRDAKPDERFSSAPLLARLAESPDNAPRVIRALQALLSRSLVETA